LGFFSAALFFGAGVKTLFNFFARLGLWGILLLAALDSSFLVAPFGNDLLLVGLVSSNRRIGYTILCVVVAAVGSILGVFIIDLIMRKAGEEGLSHFVNPNQIEKLKKKIDKQAGWALFLAALIPPPFPFTAAVITASALQISRKKLFSTVFVGRLARFGIEGMLAIFFGRQVLEIMNSKVVEYLVYGVIAIAIVGSVLSVMKWISSRKRAPRARPQPQEGKAGA
jgi:membrane protein YqaA with SNARE-associated domain